MLHPPRSCRSFIFNFNLSCIKLFVCVKVLSRWFREEQSGDDYSWEDPQHLEMFLIHSHLKNVSKLIKCIIIWASYPFYIQIQPILVVITGNKCSDGFWLKQHNRKVKGFLHLMRTETLQVDLWVDCEPTSLEQVLLMKQSSAPELIVEPSWKLLVLWPIKMFIRAVWGRKLWKSPFIDCVFSFFQHLFLTGREISEGN